MKHMEEVTSSIYMFIFFSFCFQASTNDFVQIAEWQVSEPIFVKQEQKQSNELQYFSRYEFTK